jgi:hypothetical protein
MVLVQEGEERQLFDEAIEFYAKEHKIKFKKLEEVYTKDKLGEVYYTFPGEEARVTSERKIVEIKKAVQHHYYQTPIIVLRKRDGKEILIDGHRRAKVIWELDLAWNVLVMAALQDAEFGVEKLIEGRIKDLFGGVSLI